MNEKLKTNLIEKKMKLNKFTNKLNGKTHKKNTYIYKWM